ncbi:MAG: hypothetical protein U0Z53_03275 [Blastocatellia bacterium]
MRDDMSKVVIERPRYGHALPSKKTGRRISRYDADKDYDDLPARLSGRAKYPKGGTKSFSDFLTPLERFLQSNVGRPWDKVYSELCKHLDRRKTTGRHVFQHLEAYVSVNCFYDDAGELWVDRYSGQPEPASQLRWHRLVYYVDPRTRLLCRFDPQNKAVRRHQQQARKREERRNIERIPISFDQSYVRINGEWYIGDYVTDDLRKPPADGRKCDDGLRYFDGKRWMQLISRRKCSQQERQRAGLDRTTPAR